MNGTIKRTFILFTNNKSYETPMITQNTDTRCHEHVDEILTSYLFSIC